MAMIVPAVRVTMMVRVSVTLGLTRIATDGLVKRAMKPKACRAASGTVSQRV